MLEKVELNKKISKEEYIDTIDSLREKLAILQQELKKNKIPVIVIFEGWGASGKGSVISSIINPLDPRGFKVNTITPSNEFEKRMPPLYRFWKDIPAYGNMAIFDRSWYLDVSTNIIDSIGEFEEKMDSYDEINVFEKQLTDDGYIIIKFFLHISKNQQKERFEKLMKDKTTVWRVTERDLKHNKDYEKHYKAFDVMINQTNTINAPWHIIPSSDKRYTKKKVLEIMIEQIESALENKDILQNKNSLKDILEPKKILIHPKFILKDDISLDNIELDKLLTDEEYQKTLDEYKKKLSKLHNKLYLKKIPVVIGYEGWDAAGKGGNIKRLTSSLDARGYNVATIAAPNEAEAQHHYLWRFWQAMPKTGHISIFDRTWYGRVMVERIEGFCKEEDWKRAYNEINEFEYSLNRWGCIIIKFWLQIDKEEQLRRFNEREQTPAKNYKITDEDWRNREKWEAYEAALKDMIKYTSTDFAPWTIIEANNKKYARLKALKTFIDKIEEKL